jgi:putative transposase
MLGESFDPKAELLIFERCRPHWSQAGAVVFMTFRTHDSIPGKVMEHWEQQKQEWLRIHGYDSVAHWSEIIPTLSDKLRDAFNKTFNRCREAYLDTCRGRCLLRRPELAKIVADSLLHFDEKRYQMGDFVVMPNHVHLLASFRTAEEMKRQSYSWLHYSAFRINQVIGEKGRFWQQEPFDHLVRSPLQYEYLRKYIAGNPKRRDLIPESFITGDTRVNGFPCIWLVKTVLPRSERRQWLCHIR